MGPQAFARGDHGRLPTLSPTRCFNGAAGFRPRRHIMTCIKCGHKDAASMGPQAFARGDEIRRSNRDRANDGFNGAAGFRPRRRKRRVGARPYLRPASMGPQAFARGDDRLKEWSDIHSSQLQWGRRLSPAETKKLRVFLAHEIGFNGAAGFRPRRPLCQSEHVINMIASMGPQAFARGDALADISAAPATELQWGRRLSPAETNYLCIMRAN